MSGKPRSFCPANAINKGVGRAWGVNVQCNFASQLQRFEVLPITLILPRLRAKRPADLLKGGQRDVTPGNGRMNPAERTSAAFFQRLPQLVAVAIRAICG